MSAPALLSCLGIDGWGPLHLWLVERSAPEPLRQRLLRARRALRGTGEAPPVPPALLLASLLRQESDLEPVPVPIPRMLLRRLRFRHRLVCPPGEPRLLLRSWSRAGGRWLACGPELPIDGVLIARPRGAGGSLAAVRPALAPVPRSGDRGSAGRAGAAATAMGWIGADREEWRQLPPLRLAGIRDVRVPLSTQDAAMLAESGSHRIASLPGH